MLKRRAWDKFPVHPRERQCQKSLSSQGKWLSVGKNNRLLLVYPIILRGGLNQYCPFFLKYTKKQQSRHRFYCGNLKGKTTNTNSLIRWIYKIVYLLQQKGCKSHLGFSYNKRLGFYNILMVFFLLQQIRMLQHPILQLRLQGGFDPLQIYVLP